MSDRRSQSTVLCLACLLLTAACESSPPSEMNLPMGMQTPGNVSPTAGNSPAASGTGASVVAGSGTTTAAGRSGATPSGGAGTAGSSTPGSAGTASGAAGTGTAAANPMDVGNFFSSGAWHGYVWTSVSGMGSTITPMDFSAQTTGMPRCVKGSVAATTDYSGTAILGLNLSEGAGSTGPTVTPTKAGVMIDVKMNTSSPLRFQVKSSLSGGTEWCTMLTGSGGFIPWTSLRTKCWDSTGTAYNKEPIASAMLLVPGGTMAAVPFDFCVNSLAEADAPVGGVAGTGAAGAGMAGSAAGAGISGTGGTGAGTGGAGSGASGTGGTTVPPLQGGCDGFATRYWDCCKPHCGWPANSPSGALPACDRSNNSLGGNVDAANSCTGGSAYLCHNMSPWAASDKLAYGFTAVAARSGSDICGKCYQLQFTGRSHNAGSDPGAAALGGKTLIVQAINIGGDVGSGQFDLAIPGGGVGAYNACSMQWGVSSSQLGQTYGGFLATCKNQINATDHQALKSCVMEKCNSVFGAKGLTDLEAGCRWYVDWFQVADNPALQYAEVACPDAIMGKGVRRGGGGGGTCLR